MRAVMVSHSGDGRVLVQAQVDEPRPGADEVIVAVKAISLNNGEVRHALRLAAQGYRPGWDFAGIVEHAPHGSGFAVADRVVGLAFEGAWAERVCISPARLGLIPDALGFEAAATLPVAGLTAVLCLGKKPIGRGDRLLVTAATGGVGRYALQLGRQTGAHVTAFARDGRAAERLSAQAADAIIVGVEEAAQAQPFDLILEGVGGALLDHTLAWLAPRGTIVQFGDAAGDEPTTFDARWFRLRDGGMYGGTTLYGFSLFEELSRPGTPTAAAPWLAELSKRLVDGGLQASVGRLAPWSDIDAVARALLAREFEGKAVLTLS